MQTASEMAANVKEQTGKALQDVNGTERNRKRNRERARRNATGTRVQEVSVLGDADPLVGANRFNDNSIVKIIKKIEKRA